MVRNSNRHRLLIARAIRLGVAALVFIAMLVVGANRFAPAPALGAFLNPAHGVWSLARSGERSGESRVAVSGLAGDVRVVYDDRAVPHIFATTQDDAYRALGWVVARDRLFQMHAQTLAASGRLTEIAGGRALSLDRDMRGIGLPRAAARMVATFDTAAFMQQARAYAQGVNEYITGMPAAEMPLEFRLTGSAPPVWTPIDSYHLVNRMGWTLAFRSTEGDRAAASTRVGRAAADALFPDNHPIQEPIQPTGKLSPRFDFLQRIPPPGKPDSAALLLAEAAAVFRPAMMVGQNDDDRATSSFASNNWAVSPRRSANGYALLAGDPHLDLTLPSIWYEVHLVVPGKLDVYGVTIPGAPAVIIGFNRDVAWTFTNTGADVLDYYTERVDNDGHPAKYQVDGAWRPVESRVEQYRGARGQVIATDTLYFTHRGPMRRMRDGWVSMRWTVLEAGRELSAFSEVARARSAGELQDIMGRNFGAPAQNMLAADRGGHISIRSTGRFPIRAGTGKGDVVLDGTTSANDWKGYLPVSAYPQSTDPAQGYLASANQQPVDPYAAQGWWGGNFDPWRALRINALLRADSTMTPEKMRAFQTDPGSERANLFVQYFLHAAKSSTTARLAAAESVLAAWDRRYTKDNTGAALFEEAMRLLPQSVWDELSDDGSGGRRVATPSTGVLLQLMDDPTNAWWNDRSTPDVERRDDILNRVLANALGNLERRLGKPGSAGWQWSKVRNTNIHHLLRLRALSSLELPIQGGPGTLNPSSGTGTHGASWRMVVELGPEVRAWGTYPGGQSGNPVSPRYRDHLPTWLQGELEPLRFPRTAEALAAHQRSVVVLTARH